MRRFCSGIAAIALACTIAGCGDSTVQDGAVEYKSTDISQFSDMQKSMMNSMKAGGYKGKPPAPKEVEGKTAEKKK